MHFGHTYRNKQSKIKWSISLKTQPMKHLYTATSIYTYANITYHFTVYVIKTHSLNGQRPDSPLQLQSSAVSIETNHLRHPGSKPLPHLLHTRGLDGREGGGGHNINNTDCFFFLFHHQTRTNRSKDYCRVSKILTFRQILKVFDSF